jgi:hypothetical protein
MLGKRYVVREENKEILKSAGFLRRPSIYYFSNRVWTFPDWRICLTFHILVLAIFG